MDHHQDLVQEKALAQVQGVVIWDLAMVAQDSPQEGGQGQDLLDCIKHVLYRNSCNTNYCQLYFFSHLSILLENNRSIVLYWALNQQE